MTPSHKKTSFKKRSIHKIYAKRKSKNIDPLKHKEEELIKVVEEDLKEQEQSRKYRPNILIGYLLVVVFIALGLRLLMYNSDLREQEKLHVEGLVLAQHLMTAGDPVDWNTDVVLIPGIIQNNTMNRLDVKKLQSFSDMDYGRTKQLFNVQNDYIFFFRQGDEILRINTCVHGYPIKVNENCEPDLKSIKYDALVKIERAIIYDSSISYLTIYVWR